MFKLTIGSLAFAACFFSSTASAAVDDAFTALIKQRIEAFSDASSRNDQNAMNSLLDDDVLFASGSGTVDRDEKRDKSDAVSALLKQQTQAFRDAGQRLDLAAMKRYLGDDVLLINEAGLVSELGDFRRDAPAAPPQGNSSTITLSDWVVHYSGDVAVASFVDDQAVHSGSQTINHKFLSVETWIKSGKDWKLIASQTVPLYHDPLALTLSADAMKDYLGTYAGGPGLTIKVAQDGNAITTSTNGDKPVTYDAEARDIFFSPGLPAGTPRSRLYFKRDQSGHVTGYVSGRGLVVTKAEPPATQSATQPDAQQAISSTVLPAADLIVHRSGDVAVATFIHERVTHYYGQVLHIKYRSTETWFKRGTEWKMLSLQSCELDHKPPQS